MEEKEEQTKEENSKESPRGAGTDCLELEDNAELQTEDVKCEERVDGQQLDQAQTSENKNDEEIDDQAASAGRSSPDNWTSGSSPPKRMQRFLLPVSLPDLDDPVDTCDRAEIIEHMTKYEGPAVAPNEEFETLWATMECDLRQIMKEGLIPQDSVASSGISENSYTDFKTCAEQLQSNLWEGNLLESLGNLRGFRRLFSHSTDPVLQHVFRGNPLEVLQNIIYGGNGILPEDRMQLDDPFHYANRDEMDMFQFDE